MSSNPDLQRLLANLRGESLTPGNSQEVPNDASSSTRQSYVHHNSSGTIPGLSAPSTSISDTQRSNYMANQHETRSTQSPVPVVPDASVITSWSAAVKHVSKYVVPNEKAEAKIKHMISEQHRHEQEWWLKREEIVARQAGRAGNQQKAADLLKSLGGLHIPIAPSDPKAEQAELDAYDKKVHRGLTQMSQHFDKELKQLGIPFFAIKHDLVILEDGKPNQTAQKGKLDRGELRELQKKMLEHLEALFGDE